MVLDEEQIIEDSQAAFEAEQFDPWIFDQSGQFQNLGDYLLQHTARLVGQSQKTFTTTSTDRSGIKKASTEKDTRPCQYIYMKKKIASTIPHATRDTIDQLVSSIGPEHIYWIRLCTDNLGKERNVTIKLNKHKKDILNSHYTLDHLIYFNQTITNINHTNSIYQPLQKFKIITHNIMYGIKVSPYSGF